MKRNTFDLMKEDRFCSRLFLAFVSMALFSSATLNAGVVNKTVAKVNNEVILQSDFDSVADPFIKQMAMAYEKSLPQAELDSKIADMKKKILERMIDQKLLLQEAKKKNVKISSKDIEDGLKTIKERFKTRDGKTLTDAEADADFTSELKKQDLTIAKFKDQLKDEISVSKIIDSEVIAKVVPPTEEELKTYYEKNRDKLTEPERYSVRHILIRVNKDASMKDKSQALNKIKEAQKKLKKGEDFAKVAEEYSEDPGSVKKGGDLGYVEKGMMVKNFEDVMLKTPVGKLSDYFETEFGYHILKIDAKKPEQKKSFEEVKEPLSKYMTAEKQQIESEKYVKSIRDKANITITDEKK